MLTQAASSDLRRPHRAPVTTPDPSLGLLASIDLMGLLMPFARNEEI